MEPEDRFLDLRVSSWAIAKELFTRLSGFLFRGQASASWNLEPGLGRAVRRWGLDRGRLGMTETAILREFRRRAHHYVTMPPSPEQDLEWLALIQHYGGPTRLLDFTHSPYIAAFFALENAEDEAAVWAVRRDWIHVRANSTFASAYPLGRGQGSGWRETVVRICHDIIRRQEGPPGLLYVEPLRLNERMSLQQGVFLFPCDITATFEENLFAINRRASASFDGSRVRAVSSTGDIAPASRAVVIRVRLPRHLHNAALLDLASMNVTAATLFGGLDGFARSFNLEIRRRIDTGESPSSTPVPENHAGSE